MACVFSLFVTLQWTCNSHFRESRQKALPLQLLISLPVASKQQPFWKTRFVRKWFWIDPGFTLQACRTCFDLLVGASDEEPHFSGHIPQNFTTNAAKGGNTHEVSSLSVSPEFLKLLSSAVREEIVILCNSDDLSIVKTVPEFPPPQKRGPSIQGAKAGWPTKAVRNNPLLEKELERIGIRSSPLILTKRTRRKESFSLKGKLKKLR